MTAAVYVPDTGDLIWTDFDPTKGREQAGRHRHKHAHYPERSGQLDRVHRAITAKSNESESARVASALTGDGADGSHHVRVCNQVDAIGGLVECESQRLRHPLAPSSRMASANAVTLPIPPDTTRSNSCACAAS